MTLLILGAALTLSFLPACWPCGCLILWLLRHRDIPVPRYRSARRAPALQSTGHVKGHPRTKPDWVRQRVIYYATHLASCRDVADTFNAVHGYCMTVGHSWVAEVIKAHLAEIDERRREMRRRRPKLAAVGHTWALDLTYLVSPDGATFTVLGIIDHGSRRVLALQRLPRKCALTVLGYLMLTMARYGVPAVICSDNEAMFASKLWKCVFGYLGIRHRRSRPRCPWDNGVIERLFGTLKPLLRQTRITTQKCLQQVLHEFTDFYNHVRRHRTLGGRTPMEVWQGKSLADVQALGHSGRWVQALDGLLVGFHWRC